MTFFILINFGIGSFVVNGLNLSLKIFGEGAWSVIG